MYIQCAFDLHLFGDLQGQLAIEAAGQLNKHTAEFMLNIDFLRVFRTLRNDLFCKIQFDAGCFIFADDRLDIIVRLLL
jgi:hypothetical protein